MEIIGHPGGITTQVTVHKHVNGDQLKDDDMQFWPHFIPL